MSIAKAELGCEGSCVMGGWGSKPGRPAPVHSSKWDMEMGCWGGGGGLDRAMRAVRAGEGGPLFVIGKEGVCVVGETGP